MRTSFTEIRVITLANLTYIIAKKCDRSRFYIKFVYCLRSLSEVMTWPPHADINTIISRHYAARYVIDVACVLNVETYCLSCYYCDAY